MNRPHLDQLSAWFSAYCSSFPGDAGGDPRPYRVKEEHTRRVRQNSVLIADSLGLDPDRTAIAEAVALFHDLGRFPQFRDHGTFRDSISVNHAALGAALLLEKGVLAALPQEQQRIITRAVALHNVLALPDGLDEEALLFTRVIRDADKLDIWRVFIEHYRLPASRRTDAVILGLPDAPGYTPAVLERLRRGEMVRHDMISSQNDFTLLQLSWIYDLNFPGSFRILDERGYVDDLSLTLPKDDAVARAVEGAKEYVKRKKGCERREQPEDKDIPSPSGRSMGRQHGR